MPRPDPFSTDSVYDELIAVLDKHRSRESNERQAAQDAEFERDRAAEKAATGAIITQLGETLRGFMQLEERRVTALELIARSCSDGVAKLDRVLSR